MSDQAGIKLYLMVFYKGPWEYLADALFSLDGGEIVREIKEGGLRERAANWCDKHDIAWRARQAARWPCKPQKAWRRK